MAGHERERKITVILAADAVGFSKMMGEDEENTLRNLEDCRAIADKEISTHRGRIFGSAGDSIIAEFPSAVAAVNCATKIQTALRKRNSKESSGDRMRFRIGVNLGDVIVDGDNLYGDGVNVAARLESIAEPDGVCISGSVYDLIQSKVPVDFESLGTRKLKNISAPVAIYRTMPATAVSGATATEGETSEPPAGHELEVRRWTDLISLFAILAIIAFALWYYTTH